MMELNNSIETTQGGTKGAIIEEEMIAGEYPSNNYCDLIRGCEDYSRGVLCNEGPMGELHAEPNNSGRGDTGVQTGSGTEEAVVSKTRKMPTVKTNDPRRMWRGVLKPYSPNRGAHRPLQHTSPTTPRESSYPLTPDAGTTCATSSCWESRHCRGESSRENETGIGNTEPVYHVDPLPSQIREQPSQSNYANCNRTEYTLSPHTTRTVIHQSNHGYQSNQMKYTNGSTTRPSTDYNRDTAYYTEPNSINHLVNYNYVSSPTVHSPHIINPYHPSMYYSVNPIPNHLLTYHIPHVPPQIHRQPYYHGSKHHRDYETHPDSYFSSSQVQTYHAPSYDPIHSYPSNQTRTRNYPHFSYQHPSTQELHPDQCSTNPSVVTQSAQTYYSNGYARNFDVNPDSPTTQRQTHHYTYNRVNELRPTSIRSETNHANIPFWQVPQQMDTWSIPDLANSTNGQIPRQSIDVALASAYTYADFCQESNCQSEKEVGGEVTGNPGQTCLDTCCSTTADVIATQETEDTGAPSPFQYNDATSEVMTLDPTSTGLLAIDLHSNMDKRVLKHLTFHPRKHRTFFSEMEQLDLLKLFKKSSRPSLEQINSIIRNNDCKEKLSEYKTWFQNKRSHMKKLYGVNYATCPHHNQALDNQIKQLSARSKVNKPSEANSPDTSTSDPPSLDRGTGGAHGPAVKDARTRNSLLATEQEPGDILQPRQWSVVRNSSGGDVTPSGSTCTPTPMPGNSPETKPGNTPEKVAQSCPRELESTGNLPPISLPTQSPIGTPDPCPLDQSASLAHHVIEEVPSMHVTPGLAMLRNDQCEVPDKRPRNGEPLDTSLSRDMSHRDQISATPLSCDMSHRDKVSATPLSSDMSHRESTTGVTGITNHIAKTHDSNRMDVTNTLIRVACKLAEYAANPTEAQATSGSNCTASSVCQHTAKKDVYKHDNLANDDITNQSKNSNGETSKTEHNTNERSSLGVIDSRMNFKLGSKRKWCCTHTHASNGMPNMYNPPSLVQHSSELLGGNGVSRFQVMKSCFNLSMLGEPKIREM